MFRDQITGKMSKLGEAQHKVVVAKENKEYFGWLYDEEEDEYTWEKVGSGWQIKQEVATTEDGVSIWNSWSPEQQAAFIQDLNKAAKKEVARRVVR